MKRSNNNYHGRSSNKPSLDTFVQISFAIMRMAAVSVFLLSMLLICPPGLSHASAAEKIQPANSAALPSTSLKTIIVDSLPDALRTLAAGSPNEAIRLAGEHAGEIDLLMTDVVMPEMNGRDLAKHLSAIKPHLKCLFTSGYTANVIAHHGVLDEGVYFIQKPFSRQELAAKVREVLEQK